MKSFLAFFFSALKMARSLREYKKREKEKKDKIISIKHEEESQLNAVVEEKSKKQLDEQEIEKSIQIESSLPVLEGKLFIHSFVAAAKF